MTDEEALREIDRQEMRFAAAGCGRGLRLVGSAREYYETMVELRKEVAEAKKLRSRVVQHRRIVKDGESLKNQEHMARIRLKEKIRRLAVMTDG